MGRLLFAVVLVGLSSRAHAFSTSRGIAAFRPRTGGVRCAVPEWSPQEDWALQDQVPAYSAGTGADTATFWTVLTRAPRGLPTIRTVYAYQSPACVYVPEAQGSVLPAPCTSRGRTACRTPWHPRFWSALAANVPALSARGSTELEARAAQLAVDGGAQVLRPLCTPHSATSRCLLHPRPPPPERGSRARERLQAYASRLQSCACTLRSLRCSRRGNGWQTAATQAAPTAARFGSRSRSRGGYPRTRARRPATSRLSAVVSMSSARRRSMVKSDPRGSPPWRCPGSRPCLLSARLAALGSPVLPG